MSKYPKTDEQAIIQMGKMRLTKKINDYINRQLDMLTQDKEEALRKMRGWAEGPTPIEEMHWVTYYALRRQLSVLKEVAEDYRGRTVENIINNIEQRIKFYENEYHQQHHAGPDIEED